MVRLTSLKDLVKKLAYSTSVDALKKDGVDRVNVLGMDRIVFLIESAVKRSLQFKLVSMERDQVAAATKAEFLRSLQSNDDLQREYSEVRQRKEEAEAEIDRLRRELAAQERNLEHKLEAAQSAARVRYHGEDSAIEERVGGLLGEWSSSDHSQELRDEVLGVVMEIIQNERRDAIGAREAVRDKEVSNLERRIAKLKTALSDTEGKLTQITAARHIDDGISSIYKEVQGLRDTEQHFERKQALMGDIFRANARLRGRHLRIS